MFYQVTRQKKTSYLTPEIGSSGHAIRIEVLVTSPPREFHILYEGFNSTSKVLIEAIGFKPFISLDREGTSLHSEIGPTQT